MAKQEKQLQTWATADTQRTGSVAKATSANRQCSKTPMRNATITAALSCINIERRLLKAARTNVASLAKRIDRLSALFSSTSNHPLSLRSMAAMLLKQFKYRAEVQIVYLLK